ncbi:Acg family FMN-binding oxidoreductase [Saccharomonospora piscinae]|uniref:Acg family FMN-binding oxidoreductase n=1 Tax=Saccharomonospora piscinae TaxID=687388 RepID=UPI000466E92C|nr:nitroreductase family protein [Saccharomonospora piscinae]
MTLREWSVGETDVLARAVVRAPSVHNIQPWRLELPDGEARIFERADLGLPYHDPRGRDRSISCGAAVTNLELGMRVLGKRPAVRLLPDGPGGSLVATVGVAERAEPTEAELRRYSAIARRHSYRRPFAGPVPQGEDVTRLVAEADRTDAADVRVRALHGAGEVGALAELLEYAGMVLRNDQGYQRELAIWTIRDERSRTHGAGVAGSATPTSTLPWAGLVRAGTALPDRATLTERLHGETVFVFASDTDGRDAHVRTGMAMQRLWLAAVERGLVAAVQTHPLHLTEARSRFGERLSLPGYPQLLMRVGRPAGAVPRSPRRRAAELLMPRD